MESCHIAWIAALNKYGGKGSDLRLLYPEGEVTEYTIVLNDILLIQNAGAP